MPDTPPEQPLKLAAARATIYIDIALANGQKLSFDVATATEVRDEITMALKALNGPIPRTPPKKHRNGRKKKARRQNQQTS